MGEESAGRAGFAGQAGEKEMIKYLTRFFILCSLFFVMIGCGYTTRSMISNKFTTITIVPFVNKIDISREGDIASRYKVYLPQLETDITKAVVDKYLFDGNLKPTDKESASLTLKGELVDFRRDAVRYTENNDVEEYRISIAVNLTLWDNVENKLLWEENSFTGDASYFVAGFAPANAPVTSEDSAVTNALQDLARRIVERTVEQW